MFHFKLIVFVSCLCLSNNVMGDPVKSDGGKAPRVPLNDGTSMPVLGIGTFLGFDENGPKYAKEHEVEVPVKWALEAGYRLIDTAQGYENEDQVGAALRSSDIPREDIYVVTKLSSHNQREVVQSLRESLNKMNLSYVDLFLIHSPVGLKKDQPGFDVVDYIDTWKSMEEAKSLGLTRSIGLSNFNITQIERVLANCVVKPAVLQVEVNLNLAQNKLLDFCKANDIVVMAYTPFGSMFSEKSGLPVTKSDDPGLVELAEKYSKTVPQIVLKYLVQRGLVAIPKSVRKEKIEENIHIFDFELTQDEMKTLAKLNTDYRTVLPSFWQDHPYYPFEWTDKPIPDLFKKNNK